MTVNVLLIFFVHKFINMHNCCKALWPLNMISVDDLHVGQLWVCRKKVGHLLFLYVNRKWFCWEPCMEDLGSYDLGAFFFFEGYIHDCFSLACQFGKQIFLASVPTYPDTKYCSSNMKKRAKQAYFYPTNRCYHVVPCILLQCSISCETSRCQTVWHNRGGLLEM